MEKISFEFKCMKIPTINSTYNRTINGIFKNKNVKEYQINLANYAFLLFKNKNNLFTKELEINIIFKIQNFNRDLDNMIKSTLDALQGILFKNDSQIIKLVVEKQKSKDICEYVKIIIKEYK